MPKSENMNLSIREATPADAEQVLKFLIDLDAQVGTMLLEPGERTTTPAQQADILARFQTAPKSHYLIAQINTAIIGFCVIDAKSLRRVQHRGLLVMGILPAFQNQGIGSELMRNAIYRAKQSGLLKLELTVIPNNAPALALYRKFNFIEEGLCKMALYSEGNYSDLLYMGLMI